MKIKVLGIAAFAAVLCVLAFGSAADLLGALALPFTALGGLMRWLSLSGVVGNALALAVYVLICAVPLVLWMRSHSRAEDWLMVALSLVLAFVMYLMVNPGLRPVVMRNEVGDVCYAGAVWSLLLTWGVGKLLRSGEGIQTRQIYAALRIFLVICAAVCVLDGFGLGFGGLREQIRTLREANTMFGVNLWPTTLFYGLEFAVEAAEQTLLALVFWKAAQLLQALEADPYSGACAEAGAQLAIWCRRTLLAAVCADLAVNLTMILCAGMLHDVSVTVRLPVASVAVCFGMMALERLLVQGWELKDDNDLFI